MEITLIQDESTWGDMKDEWNQLLTSSSANLPFLRHEYLTAWWQHRGGGEWPEAALYILTARSSQGDLTGVAPFFISKNNAGKQAVMFLGSIEISDFLDVIVRPEDQDAFIESILAYLAGQETPSWDVLDLYNLLEDSDSLAALESFSGKFNYQFERETIQPAPIIRLPGDFESYTASLDKKYRHELRRKIRNAAGYPVPTSWSYIEDPEEQKEFMLDFSAMMREEQDKDEFLTDEMILQMTAIVEAGYQAGFMRFACFYVGEEHAAGYLIFDYDNRIWVYNSGMARKHSRLSPGIVLMGHLIMDAIEKGREAVDLMRGDETYKYHMGGENRYVVRATITR